MNIVEAEKFFKEYDGNSFYMYDQDLLKYNQYRSMKISSKQENIWRIQKAKIYSSEIEKSDKPWLVYFKMDSLLEPCLIIPDSIDIMLDTGKKVESKLDAKNSMNIAETIIGRSDVSAETGWIFRSYHKKCKKQMIEFCRLVERLLNEANKKPELYKISEIYNSKYQLIKYKLRIIT